MIGLNTTNELDKKTIDLISKMEETLKSKDKEIEFKDKTIIQLQNEIENLKSQIKKKNRSQFGKSSEQVSKGQLALFNEAEKESDLNKKEPTNIKDLVPKKKKHSKKKTKNESFKGLEKIIIEHKLEEEEQFCKTCNAPLSVIGKTTKQILKYIPAKLYVEEHVIYKYKCISCEEKDDKSTIINGETPNTFLYKSMASNELLSHIIYLKYKHAMPLYRQTDYFKMMNAEISRQTLSNWIIKSAMEFEPIYNKMKEELLKTSYIQADETTLKVLNAKEEELRLKHYMWLYKTGNFDNPILLYDYQKTRSGDCPQKFLKEYE